MSLKFVLGLVAITASIFEGNCNCNNDDQNKLLTITISFESEIVCTDDFFGSQLTKEIIQKFNDCQNIKWEFEPCEESYICEKTKKLVCQKGEEQCALDRMQACTGKIYGSDGFHYGLFVACMLNTRDPPSSGPICAHMAGFCWNKINECITSGNGDKYCDEFYRRIQKRKPSWIPSIMFDKKYVEDDDTQAKKDFTKTVCHKLKAKNLTCNVCNNVN